MNDSSWRRIRGWAVSATVIAAGVMLLQGCRSSPWESEYRSSGAVAAPLTKEAPVRIREVPWERIQQTLVELDRERIASDIHPDDWDAGRKLQARTQLLRGLQISEDPRSVEVLGRSVFRTTEPIRPDDGVLIEFARKKGATTVVWTSSYMGKTDVIRSEPITEWHTGTWQRWHDNRGSLTWSESSTIWVPVVISADERAWMAYFLRESAPASSAGASPVPAR